MSTPNPVLRYARKLTEAERESFKDLLERQIFTALDADTDSLITAWQIEVKRLLDAPDLATDTNDLVRVTSLLSDDDRAGLILQLGQWKDALASGPFFNFVSALGFMVAITPPATAGDNAPLN